MSEAAMGEGTRAVRVGLPEPVKNETTLPCPGRSSPQTSICRGEVSGP
jgi:cystathionine gamma-lyase